MLTVLTWGFPGGSDSEESACNAGDLGLTLGSGRAPGGGHGNPLQYSCLEHPHGQRSLEDCSLWGCKDNHIVYTRPLGHFQSLRFQGKPFNITTIQVYAPTGNAKEAEVEQFCEELQNLLELTPKKDIIFITED